MFNFEFIFIHFLAGKALDISTFFPAHNLIINHKEHPGLYEDHKP